MNAHRILFVLRVALVSSLFLACSERNPKPEENARGEDSSVTIADTLRKAPKDSIYRLGGTGYTVRVPAGFEMITRRDSLFQFVPSDSTFDCNGLNIGWSDKGKGIPRIGMKASGSITQTVNGQYCTFAEYSPVGVECSGREGYIDDGDNRIRISCNAQQGETMERLFGIALSLRREK